MALFSLFDGNRNSLLSLSLKSIGLLGALLLLLQLSLGEPFKRSSLPPSPLYGTQPLVMVGGDPYIRALMRTISASEANVKKPYHVIYGGQYISDLNRHPSQCVKILRGPNRGLCSTAAGRYQMINTTWYEKAQQYHPEVSQILWWKSYSFEPEYQDRVVYSWLSDSQAWGVDISQLLRQGKVKQVLSLLSPTWTSLGYGIETNSMSLHLPRIYQEMLQEELTPASVS